MMFADDIVLCSESEEKIETNLGSWRCSLEEKMDKDPGNIDELIDKLGGCGAFQYVISFLLIWVKMVGSMSMIMMTFGIYNPGWDCMDNTTMLNSSFPKVANISSKNTNNNTETCQLYEKCDQVQFNPQVSTVISEWSLVCDQSWLSSLIISIQMFGVLIGAYMSGYLGDKFGRKKVMYTAMFLHCIFNLIAIFSNSWEMFAAMRFVIGMTVSFLIYLPVVLALEYAPTNWRSVEACFPSWSLGCTLLAVAAMVTENWRHLHAINFVASLLGVITYLWVPESLRWLVVKNKMNDAHAAVKRIAYLNRTKVNSWTSLQQIAIRLQVHSETKSEDSCLHLLRKGFRYTTVAIGLSMISMSMIYYVLSFSIKSLPGNFYINMLLMFTSEIPFSLLTAVLPNYFGRKNTAILMLVLSSLSLYGIVGLDLRAEGELQVKGILACAMLTRVTIDGAWDTYVMYVAEIYPTLIRSTSIAYTSWVARIGGILAPYLLPNDPETYYISYLIMGSCAFVCSIAIVFIPETKGKALNETWKEDGSNPKQTEAILNGEHRREEEKL